MRDGEEIEPPWVAYPGHSPGDGFWRQSGEHWLMEVWRPFWDSLSGEKQNDYLERWRVPAEWRQFYFDQNFAEWLDGVDDD